MKTSTLLKINETGFALCLIAFMSFVGAAAFLPVLAEGPAFIKAVIFGLFYFGSLATLLGFPMFLFAKVRLSKY